MISLFSHLFEFQRQIWVLTNSNFGRDAEAQLWPSSKYYSMLDENPKSWCLLKPLKFMDMHKMDGMIEWEVDFDLTLGLIINIYRERERSLAPSNLKSLVIERVHFYLEHTEWKLALTSRLITTIYCPPE